MDWEWISAVAGVVAALAVCVGTLVAVAALAHRWIKGDINRVETNLRDDINRVETNLRGDMTNMRDDIRTMWGERPKTGS